jgi:hypothetical protein
MKVPKLMTWLIAAIFVLSARPGEVRAGFTPFGEWPADHHSFDGMAVQLNNERGANLYTQWFSHDADTLVLSCMDFRLISHISTYMDKISKKNMYDHTVLAGASLGVNDTAHPDWGRTFWDHLKLSRDLHNIKNVMVIDHRNCGAYNAILHEDYPERETKAQLDQETTSHKKQLDTLAHAIHEKYPFLGIQTRLMALDGSVEEIANLKGEGAFPDHRAVKH